MIEHEDGQPAPREPQRRSEPSPLPGRNGNQLARTPPTICWLIAVVAAMAGGLGATVASVLAMRQWWASGWGVLLMGVTFAPTAEEIMKIAPAAYLVARRPHWFRHVEQIRVATLGAAVLFAVVENLIYLYVYAETPSPALMAWRWSVCTALHVGCTMLATRGLIEAWQHAVTEYRRPRIIRALRYVVPAIAIHGAYNASIIGYEALARTSLPQALGLYGQLSRPGGGLFASGRRPRSNARRRCVGAESLPFSRGCLGPDGLECRAGTDARQRDVFCHRGGSGLRRQSRLRVVCCAVGGR